MKNTFRLNLSLKTISLAILLCMPVAAEDAIHQRDFGFQPLEIFKFDNGTSSLIVEDINGDGLDDILFSNNHVSRLEILVRTADTERTDDLP